jgi:hypothetical protein
VVIHAVINADTEWSYTGKNPSGFFKGYNESSRHMEHGGIKMKLQKISTIFVFSILFFSIFLTVGAQRPELEVRQRGGIFLNALNYTLEIRDENTIKAICSITMTNVGEESIDEMSFDIVVQSGEIEDITFSDETGNTLSFETNTVGVHYLMDVTLHEPLNPGDTYGIINTYFMKGVLEKKEDVITTRAPLLIPIVKESSGKTKITIEMIGPVEFQCTQAIPQPSEKTVVENSGYTTWEMSMLPPSILFVTYKPIGTTSVSINTLILVGIAIWVIIVAFYGYKKLK